MLVKELNGCIRFNQTSIDDANDARGKKETITKERISWHNEGSSYLRKNAMKFANWKATIPISNIRSGAKR